MARRTGWRRPKEVVLAEGRITKDVPATTLEKSVINEGTKVKIARIIKTPIGLRFRIFNTTRWIPEDHIDCSHDAECVVDYTKHLENPEKSKFMELFGDEIKKKELKPSKKSVNTYSVSKKRHTNIRINAMDKQELKKAINSLNTGDQVTVTFLSTFPPECVQNESRYGDVLPFVGQAKTYTLLQTKKGRGKGGSQLMVLESSDGTRLSVGTPHSETILSVQTPEGLFGHKSEKDVEKVYETNAGQAATLLSSFKDLLDKPNARVQVEATEDKFTGTFTVTSAEQLRGRHGQVRLTLKRNDGSELQLWSYRHSGVVTSFKTV